jgi:hypothetical protein
MAAIPALLFWFSLGARWYGNLEHWLLPSPSGEGRGGTAETSKRPGLVLKRLTFRPAPRLISPRTAPERLHRLEIRDVQYWTTPISTQTASIQSRCFCGAVIDIERHIKERHLTDAQPA